MKAYKIRLRRAALLLLLLPVLVLPAAADGDLEAFASQSARQEQALETAAPLAAQDAVQIAAPSAVLIDQATGTLIYEKNGHEKLPPASVTKVMTLLLVMEALERGQISWDDTVITSETAAAKGGSQVYLEPGEEMPLRDMLKSVVVSSANDCATALAEHVAGSEEAFVAKMNERAAELGMQDTHFVNCTGLDDSEAAQAHRTSAYDIALMSRQLLQHDEIREYTTIWMDTVRGGKFGLANTNKLVRFYQGTTGLKTGFTSGAGYCLSASAQRSGVEFIAVVLHCGSSQDRFASAKALLDYGFANYTLVSPQVELQTLEIPVKLGESGTVQAELQRSGPLLVEKSQAAGISQEMSLPSQLEAPVTQGQVLGELTLQSGGQVLGKIPLVAGQAVARLRWWQAARRVLGGACFGA